MFKRLNFLLIYLINLYGIYLKGIMEIKLSSYLIKILEEEKTVCILKYKLD